MMTEVRDALKRVEDAQKSLAAILSLPTTLHARVRWDRNGVVWTRVADDDWRNYEQGAGFGLKYSSAHVASKSWTHEESSLVSS